MQFMAEAASGRSGSSEEYPRTSYGNACMNCSRSKAKCTASRIGAKCERCNRLNKNCTKGRKRGDIRKATSSVASLASKTNALEEKIDGIFRILQQSHPNASSLQVDFPLVQPGINQTQERSTRNHRGQSSISPAPPEALTEIGGLDSHAAYTPSCSSANEYPLESEAECEEYLATYRLKMLTFFPAVVIPASMTLKDLRMQRPFLWLVIRAICSKSSVRQRALGAEILKKLGNDLVLESTKSLDLLLGIVVFGGWGHHYLSQGPMHLATVILLGQTLAAELGLLKPIPRGPFGTLLGYSRQQSLTSAAGLLDSTGTMEERRAVIGLFYVTSIAANHFHRIEPMRWTPYLDECLQKLSQAKEYVTDELLVYLVRVQLLCDRVMGANIPPVVVPQDFYVQMFQSQMDELQNSIPESLQSNKILQLHILDALIGIHERSLTSKCQNNDSPYTNAHLLRVESLWACFNATKSWIVTSNSTDCLGVASYPHMSLAIFAQMAHCMISLFRLSIFESSGVSWDRQRVRKELEFGEVVKVWIGNGKGVPGATGMDVDMAGSTEENAWSHLVRRLSLVVEWWDTKVVPILAASESREQASKDNSEKSSFDASNLQMGEAMDLTTANFDFFDDTWMRDMTNGSDEYLRDAFY